MVVLIHVVIALTSLAYTSWLNFKPRQKGFYAAYGLVALTLSSGAYLVISTGSSMIQACQTGLLYLGFSVAGLVFARRKLSAQNEDNS